MESGKRPILIALRGQDKLVKKLLQARKSKKAVTTAAIQPPPALAGRTLQPSRNGGRHTNGNARAKDLIKV